MQQWQRRQARITMLHGCRQDRSPGKGNERTHCFLVHLRAAAVTCTANSVKVPGTLPSLGMPGEANQDRKPARLLRGGEQGCGHYRPCRNKHVQGVCKELIGSYRPSAVPCLGS
eukprot:354533-Chlamydomonas_euryale.AAC.3